MQDHDSISGPDLGTWLAETLRITCFPSSPVRSNEVDWWHDLTGEQPENQILRPKEGLRRDEGHVDGVRLVLGVQPMRIDWLVVPDEIEDVLSIGPFEDSLNSFIKLMSPWLKTSPPVSRLAFGATLMFPVEDRKSGYELLAGYLPYIKLDPEGSSDFLYQINRPRNSRTGIQDLRINRLSRWSVALRATTQVEFSVSEGRVSYLPTLETLACRLELDINTAPSHQGDLPCDQLGNILQELAELGKEIAIEGDIP